MIIPSANCQMDRDAQKPLITHFLAVQLAPASVHQYVHRSGMSAYNSCFTLAVLWAARLATEVPLGEARLATDDTIP